MPNFKFALFDLDGTLLDSTYVWTNVDEVFLKKRGFDVPCDYVESLAHMSAAEASMYTKKLFNLPESGEDIVNEWRELAAYEYENNVQLKNGAIDYLNYLKDNGITMVITTGLSHALLTPAINRLGIKDFFSGIFSADDVSKGKGNPDLFLLAMDNIGATTQECIIFDDVMPVMKVAKQIGCLFCAVQDKENLHNEDKMRAFSDYYISDWSQAPKLSKNNI